MRRLVNQKSRYNMENVLKANLEKAAIEDATREKAIENADLLREISLILPDYFMIKSMIRSADSILLEFYNGDIKRVRVESADRLQ